MINLTRQDRDKFYLWLKQEIEADSGIIKQMEKMSSPAMQMVVKKKKIQMQSKIIVSDLLMDSEEMTIS